MCTHTQAQAAAKDMASEQQTLAMQIRVLRKEYQDKAIAIRWANRRKARLLGSSATPIPSEVNTLKMSPCHLHCFWLGCYSSPF